MLESCGARGRRTPRPVPAIRRSCARLPARPCQKTPPGTTRKAPPCPASRRFAPRAGDGRALIAGLGSSLMLPRAVFGFRNACVIPRRRTRVRRRRQNQSPRAAQLSLDLSRSYPALEHRRAADPSARDAPLDARLLRSDRRPSAAARGRLGRPLRRMPPPRGELHARLRYGRIQRTSKRAARVPDRFHRGHGGPRRRDRGLLHGVRRAGTPEAHSLPLRMAYVGHEASRLRSFRGRPLASPHAGPYMVEKYDATCVTLPGPRASIDPLGNIFIKL
jgi:hypothetical protein